MRVETDLKLNLSMLEEPTDESSATSTELVKRDLIAVDDSELVKQVETHFIMFEGLTSQHEMGLVGFLKMLWKSRSLELMPEDGRW